MNAILLYRVSRWFFLKRIPLVPKILYLLNFLVFNSSIPFTAVIGEGTRFGYGGMGVVIHARAVIGRNCIIAQQVTIGGKAGCDEPPKIGDNVYIATGAKILGDISIGNDCVIGANAVVIRDVPDRSVAAGVPAKIIKTDIDVSFYF